MTLNTMIKAGLGGTFATLTMASLAIPATATTITFENLNINFFTGSQTEGDFTYEVVSGNFVAITSIIGNPASSLSPGFPVFPSPGDTIEFFLTDGGLFTFDSFDFASLIPSTSSTVNFFGEVNSVDTESLLGINSGSTTFQTQDPGFASAIDRLRIEVVSGGSASLLLDNLELTPAATESVPEPSVTVGLLGLVGGLAVRSLSKKRNSGVK